MNILIVLLPFSSPAAGNYDYEGVTNQVVTFDPATDRQTVTINVRNDGVYELQENFFGQLTTTDTGVELFDNTTTANIVDSNSKDYMCTSKL